MSSLKELERENERLYSHHSDCKRELADLVELSNKWRIRAYVAEKIAVYLNGMNPWWNPEDLKTEIEINTKSLFEKWKRGEKWWDDEAPNSKNNEVS